MSEKLYLFAVYFPKKNNISFHLQIFFYQVLTDTDSTSIQFVFLSDPANKSDEFWRYFNVQTTQESTF